MNKQISFFLVWVIVWVLYLVLRDSGHPTIGSGLVGLYVGILIANTK